MLRSLIALCLCLQLAGADQLDPQINVMNVGKVIDVQPHVSHDRKYITLGVNAGSSRLVRMNRADIITFHVLGLQPFSDAPGHVLKGRWDMQGGGDRDNTDYSNWHMQINKEGKVSGRLHKNIDGCVLKSFNLKKNSLLFQFNHIKPGPKRRSAMTGKERPPEYTHSYFKGSFSDDLQRIEGQVIVDGRKSPLSLQRENIQLPKSITATFSCAISIQHRSYENDTAQTLKLTFDEQTLSAASWEAVHDLQCCVVRWLPEQREVAILVSYKLEAGDKKRSVAIINGTFNASFDELNACFDTPDYGQALIKMQKQ